MATNLRVSLEPHLVETLRPLIGLTTSHLSEELSTLLPDESSSASQSMTPPMIPYALLQSISKWARTEEGETALTSKDPSSRPIGFPTLPRVPSRSEGAAREISDKRAIIAVLNAVLTVICTGAAAWWAAQRTGWRDEWKVLLSLLAATIVAVSEIGLYIIWETRRERGRRSTPSERPPSSVDTVRDGKSRDIDDENASLEPAHLGHASSQTTSSVDPHQQIDRQALRQRASIKPKLSG
ncbi:hypothetical protein EDB89DRAFT_2075910 [Lactarius sanguifluus]|nr:hypothetical protein EDB89DRAFT_2075910 [Lactarius sanguifluus]